MRKAIAAVLAGPVWWVGVMVFFKLSGAPGILANPEYQSENFLQLVASLPPPRATQDPWFIWIGMFVIGLFLSFAVNFRRWDGQG